MVVTATIVEPASNVGAYREPPAKGGCKAALCRADIVADVRSSSKATPTADYEGEEDEDTFHETSDLSSSDSADHTAHPVAIKCSAVHTMERDMPDFDISHLVDELRDKILAECEQNPGIYSQSDISKCKQDEWFVKRFLLRQKLDVGAALNMIKAAMRFRHESLCNSIRAEDFPAEFYKIGGLFGYEPDRKGNKMLYIRVKIHRKLPEIQAVVQAFLYYNLCRLDDEANGRGISLVFDCTGGGLVNADMDMLLFLVSTLVNYFPKGFSYLLVHNLPWILKPIWHIAKAWVSEEHRQLIKFSDARTIYEYIDRENLPDFMGGTCKREYQRPPDNCTTLYEAAKLWGVERDVARKILAKFAEYLPDEGLDKIEGQLDRVGEMGPDNAKDKVQVKVANNDLNAETRTEAN